MNDSRPSRFDFEHEPALAAREDDRELRALMRRTLNTKRKTTKPLPGTPEHRQAMVRKLIALRRVKP